jgi:hypothetical protein
MERKKQKLCKFIYLKDFDPNFFTDITTPIKQSLSPDAETVEKGLDRD